MTSEPAHDSVHVRELWMALRRRRSTVAVVTALVVAIAAYLAHGIKPQYRAQASVRLTNPRRAMTSNIADESQQQTDYTEDRRVSKIQVLTSRTLVGVAVERDPARYRLRLNGAPLAILKNVVVAPDASADSVVLDFGPQGMIARSQQGSATAAYGTVASIGGLRFSVASRPLASRAVLQVASQEDAVSRLLGGLSAKQREQADVIDVSFTDGDPRFAQQVVNGLVQTFATGDIQDAQQTSKRRRVFIEEQSRHNDSLLAAAQSSLATFRARAGTFSAKDRFATEQQGLAGLGTQREALASERAAYQTLLSAVTRSRTSSAQDRARALAGVPAAANNPIIAQLYNQLATYQTRRDSLTTGPWAHAATHPDVQQVDTLLASSQAKLVEAAQAQLASIDERLGRIDQMSSQNASVMQRMPAVEAEELRLSNEVESLRKLGEQLREEYQKSRISEAVQVGGVEILDLAPLPMAPLGVGRSVRVLMGLLVGLVLGCGAAFLRERLDGTISRRAELQDVLHLAALAVVPRTEGGTIAHRSMLERLLGRRAPEPDGPRALPVLDRTATEAFVTMRTNLLYSHAAGTPRTIVVTSSAPGDGKTTISSNLARAYAQQGSRVLLVDCDLRRSRLHRVFGVRANPGLTDLLVGRAADKDAISSTTVPNLYILPAGRAPENAAELIGGDAMNALLERAREQYDVLILDTPPALAVADAAILGAKADGVLFVVRAGATERDAALAAIDQLSGVGARIVGAVLNDPDHRVASYPGYYYYAEYYSRPADATSAAA